MRSGRPIHAYPSANDIVLPRIIDFGAIAIGTSAAQIRNACFASRRAIGIAELRLAKGIQVVKALSSMKRIALLSDLGCDTAPFSRVIIPGILLLSRDALMGFSSKPLEK